MAEFTTKCPHCDIELVADEKWIGMVVECSTCGQSFTVAKEAPNVPKLSIPQIKPVTPAAGTNAGNAKTSFTFVCPECGTQVELPIVLKGKKYECKACCEESIAEPATEKKCPHCGETIKFHATICKFCRKNVDVSANAPKLNLPPISPTGNRPVNVQPIQNPRGINLQPINPVQNQMGVHLQPINPNVPKLSIPQIKPVIPVANTNAGNAETSFTFVCPECGTQVELPIILKGKKYECKACCEESIAEPATEKKCPHCGETIKFHATICKFCRKNVDVSANAPKLNLQPISPIGNQPVNVQPIQNPRGINLQPINPIQNSNGINLQPVNPIQNAPYNSVPVPELIYCNQQTLTPISNQNISPIQRKNKSRIFKYSTPESNRETIIAILWGLSAIMWIISAICCFIDGALGLSLLLIAFLLSVASFLLKKSETFELLPDEQILSTCRLVCEKDNVTYFTRLTNKRIVLSAVEYPLLPAFIAMFIELMARPKRITYACEWNKVMRIETELKKGTLFKIKKYHTVLETSDITYHFRTAPKLVDFWETRKGIF